MKTQIGWYIVEKDTVFHNQNFSYAAWWEDVEVKAGKYPAYVYDMTVDNDGRISGQGVYANMEGTIVADYFAGHYCGMPISDYDTKQNAGNPSEHRTFAFLYMVAESIVNGENKWELLSGFEARKIEFLSLCDNEMYTTHGIFKVA